MSESKRPDPYQAVKEEARQEVAVLPDTEIQRRIESIKKARQGSGTPPLTEAQQARSYAEDQEAMAQRVERERAENWNP